MEVLDIANSQRPIARKCFILSGVCAALAILPFIEGHPLSQAWAMVIVGVFLMISCFAAGLMFKGRAGKMDNLRTGEKLLVHLELDERMLADYAGVMRDENKEKSKALMWVIGIMFAIVTPCFLFFLEWDEMRIFLAIIGTVVLTIFGASLFFPWYYYRKNMNGDRRILIGEKYAYFNGYFHNWDFPMSGLTTVKAIEKPFSGIHLSYYYTDRTFRHVHEIKFPIPDGFDPEPLIKRLKAVN